MSRISFEKKDRQLILCYETESDWLEEKLEEDQDFQIYKTFLFCKNLYGLIRLTVFLLLL